MTERAVHTAGQFDARSRADVAYLADRLEAQPTFDAVYLAACILGVSMMRPQLWLRGIVAWGSWRTGDPKAIVWARVMTRFPEIAVQTVDATVKWMRTGKDADGEGIGGFNQREIDQMARLLTPAEDRSAIATARGEG